ncbi:MAG: tetratricopeptide repeat protein [Spirochaetota bacterium]
MSKKEQEKTLLEKYVYSTIAFAKENIRAIVIWAVVTVILFAAAVSGAVLADIHRKDILNEYTSIMEEYEKVLSDEDPSDDDIALAAQRIAGLADRALFGYIKRNGYYIAAGIFFQNENYPESKEYYEMFLTKQSSSELAPLAQFQSAVCSEWLDKPEEAFFIYKQMEADLQDTRYMERIVYDIARLYAQRGEEEKAKEYYNRVLTEYPSSYYANQSRKRLMLLHYESGSQ